MRIFPLSRATATPEKRHFSFKPLCSFQFHSVVLLVLTSCPALFAQNIQIKLLDGKSGCPIADACVNVWVGNGRKDAMGISTDKYGVAALRRTGNADAIQIHDGGACGALGVVDPVVKYADTIRVNVGYVACASHKSDFSWLVITGFPTQDLIERGIVTQNTCGKASALQKPGELTIFVRPLTFWEKLKQ
jgi:hypothetical protein